MAKKISQAQLMQRLLNGGSVSVEANSVPQNISTDVVVELKKLNELQSVALKEITDKLVHTIDEIKKNNEQSMVALTEKLAQIQTRPSVEMKLLKDRNGDVVGITSKPIVEEKSENTLVKFVKSLYG